MIYSSTTQKMMLLVSTVCRQHFRLLQWWSKLHWIFKTHELMNYKLRTLMASEVHNRNSKSLIQIPILTFPPSPHRTVITPPYVSPMNKIDLNLLVWFKKKRWNCLMKHPSLYLFFPCFHVSNQFSTIANLTPVQIVSLTAI